METLPFDIHKLIIEHVDIANFCLVCRSWNNIVRRIPSTRLIRNFAIRRIPIIRVVHTDGHTVRTMIHDDKITIISKATHALAEFTMWRFNDSTNRYIYVMQDKKYGSMWRGIHHLLYGRFDLSTDQVQYLLGFD